MTKQTAHKRKYVKAAGKTKYSKSWQKKDSPWQTDPLAMARKTVIRRAFTGSQIPMSSGVRQMILADQLNETIIDGEVVDTSPDAAVQEAISESGMNEAGVQKELALKGDLDT